MQIFRGVLLTAWALALTACGAVSEVADQLPRQHSCPEGGTYVGRCRQDEQYDHAGNWVCFGPQHKRVCTDDVACEFACSAGSACGNNGDVDGVDCHPVACQPGSTGASCASGSSGGAGSSVNGNSSSNTR